MNEKIVDRLYFVFARRAYKNLIFFNLMGLLSFYKSAQKHWKRGSPSWLVFSQMKGCFMSFRQLIVACLSGGKLR